MKVSAIVILVFSTFSCFACGEREPKIAKGYTPLEIPCADESCPKVNPDPELTTTVNSADPTTSAEIPCAGIADACPTPAADVRTSNADTY